MALVSTDFVFYGAANRPGDDSSLSGGGIDLLARPIFTQFSGPDVVALASSGGDTRTVTVVGRDTSGLLRSENVLLAGVAEVTTAVTFERVLSLTADAQNPARTITAYEGSLGPVFATIEPDETIRYALFQESYSENSIQLRHEKLFCKNIHGTLTLNEAIVRLTADPLSKYRIGTALSLNDTGSVSNRKAFPASVGFVDDNIDAPVPGGVLPPGDAIGIWVEQRLATLASGFKTDIDITISGGSI
jgi:hypothetical protein